MMVVFLIALDVNECDIGNGGCQDVCDNNDGSFVCSCADPSQAITDDGLTCGGKNG